MARTLRLMNEQEALQHVARAIDWFGGAIAISATGVGIELGLFEALKERGRATPEQLADALALNGRAVDVWAKTLVHHGLLEPAGVGEVALAPGVELLVCEPRTLYNLAPLFEFHARFASRDFLDLPAFFRDGVARPAARHGLPLVRNVARQTASMHAVFASTVLPALPEVAVPLASGGTVLDAGCGTGDLGIQVCSEFSAAHYLGVDLDSISIAEGRRIVAATGLEERVRLEAIAVEAVAPASVDAATFFLSLHEFPLEARPSAVAAVRAALKPGGWLLVFDELYPATPLEALNSGARTAIQFQYEELLWGTVVPTANQLDALLYGAGFSEVVRRPMLEGGIEIVLARVS